MIKVLFICHGNICRSPIAEWIMKSKIAEYNLSGLYEIASAATSREELGNDIYPPAKDILRRHGIPFCRHSARQICKADYNYYDRIICMDENNVRNAVRFFSGDPQGKIGTLLKRSVADPWYTGDFETAYQDIQEGICNLLRSDQSNAT